MITGSTDQAKSVVMAVLHQCAEQGIRPVLGIPMPILDIPQPWQKICDLQQTQKCGKEYVDWLRQFTRALCVKQEKLISKGIASVKSRVTNLRPYLSEGTTLEDFKERLLQYLSLSFPIVPHPLTQADCDRINQICAERYAKWEWNYGYSPNYTDIHKRRIEGCGEIEAHLCVAKGLILDIRFYGDFFGASDLSPLRSVLWGCECRRESIVSRLEDFPLEEYIRNISAEQLAEIIAY